MPGGAPIRVIVAGGGVAAVEAVLALERHAGARAVVTLLTPRAQLDLRALSVVAPFSEGAERRRFPLAPLLERMGGELVEDALAAVDPAGRTITTSGGRMLSYDALIVAVGARARAPWPGVRTFGVAGLSIGALLSETQSGSTHRVAFVVPPGITWPLPAYELALLTRRRAADLGMAAEISVVTPEAAPLEVLGPPASARVGVLLADAGIALHPGVEAVVAPSGRIRLAPSTATLEPHRIVTLPVLDGPRVEGLPGDERGFVPVDAHARVEGLRDVYCAGDAAAFPIKQGGLAAQQAEAAALHVAALAGAPVTALPFRPVLRARLLTGGADEYFVKPVHRPAGERSTTPLWSPPAKVHGRHLAPWLAGQDPALSPADPAGRAG